MNKSDKKEKVPIDLNNINLSSSVSECDLEEEDNDVLETKKSILKAFDDKINQNKEELKHNSIIQQKREEIFKIAKVLKVDIKNLEAAINEIVKKQHNDYMSTFSTFMDSIRKELTKKLEEMEKQYEEKRKSNDIKLIKCERDFFRLEAVRLNGICKSFKEKIDELSFRNKLISDELNNMKTKWKESENINKQLLFELEANIQSNKEMEEELNITKNMLNKTNDTKLKDYKKKIMDGTTENSKINNITEFDSKEEEQPQDEFANAKKNKEMNLLTEKVRRYKHEAKLGREKAHRALTELNKLYLEKNKLENIFNECVKATKNNIYNRKLKEKTIYKVKNKEG